MMMLCYSRLLLLFPAPRILFARLRPVARRKALRVQWGCQARKPKHFD